jgi:hypothetical protein
MAQNKSKAIISKIIKEEVKSFFEEVAIKEQGGDNFRTKVSVEMDDATMIRYGIVKDRDESLLVNIVRKQEVSIIWSVEYEYRSWGIKSISPYVPDQKVVVTFEKDTGMNYEEFEKEIQLKNVETEFIPADLGSSPSLSLSPSELEFDDNKIIVRFNI